MSASHYVFGCFELDPQSGELRRRGRPVALAAQPTRALLYLVARAGSLVPREELQAHIWGDTVVEVEQGLNACIRQIRTALGDRAEAPRFIATVPRQGYRFVAEVERRAPDPRSAATSEPAMPPRRWTRRTALAILLAGLIVAAVLLTTFLVSDLKLPGHDGDRTLLAVLPFENLSDDPEQDYFSDGLTEELITELARLAPDRLGVIARTSAMRYKGSDKPVTTVGRELGVDYVLEGSVRSGEAGVRIVAQLIRVDDQSHEWAERYDRRRSDALTVQLDVALQVAGALDEKLLSAARPQEPQQHPKAREAYLKGRYFLNRSGREMAEKALAAFEEAVRIEPGYAAAYLGQADAVRRLGGRDAHENQLAALRRARELDDRLAEVHSRLGQLELYVNWDLAAAERSILRALSLEPGRAETQHNYALYLSIVGRHDDAVAALERALELDPFSSAVQGDGAQILFAARRYREAIELCTRVLELEPDRLGAYNCLFESQYQLALASGDFTAPLATAEKLMAALGASTVELSRLRSGTSDERLEAYFEWNLALQQQRQAPATLMAAAHLGVGDIDRTFDWLEEAYRQRSAALLFLGSDPRAERFRDDPRLLDLLRRIGLPIAVLPHR